MKKILEKTELKCYTLNWLGDDIIKKVVFCVLNSKYIHSSLAPWCLYAGVRDYAKSDASCVVIEGTINENILDVAERISKASPDVVGFSIYIWNKIQTYELISEIKRIMPKIQIIVGGPEVSYNMREVLLENRNIDYGISGEGEYPIAMLIDYLNCKRGVEDVPGLSYRYGNDVVVSEPYVSEKEPPTPYCQEYFDKLSGRIAYLETSRGCPFSCAFCLSGRIGGVRFFDVEKAKANILLLAKSGAKTIKLVDRTFNADRKRANEIFKFIISNYGREIPRGVCFHFEIAGDLLDEETIEILREAPLGAIQFEIGIQSFNEKTLSHINRKTNLKRLKENIRALLKNKNIHIHIDLIAGLSFEDLDSFKESFDSAYFLNADMLQLGFLKLLHGAPMREEKDIYPCEFSKEPPYEVISTPYLSENDLIELHTVESALDKLSNSGRFSRSLKYLFCEGIYTPYNLFFGFGKSLKQRGKERCSLDELTNLFYRYIGEEMLVDMKIFRDKMIADRLSCSPTGVIPEALYVRDENILKVKKYLNSVDALKEKKGIKRSIAILYSQNCAIYADYFEAEKENGYYKLHEIDLDLIL